MYTYKKLFKNISIAGLIALILLVPFVYVHLVRPRKTDAAWYSGSWDKRRKITINNSQVSGTTNFTNFPILVSVSDGDLKNYAQSDADDILFTSQDGSTKLDHEVEKYTGSTGTLVAWVEVPTLYAQTDTVIYMYYGNASATSQQNPTGVWDLNYAAVWHFSETSGQHLDSTSNNNDSTSVSVTTQGSATGKVDGADLYSNGGENVVVQNSASLQITSAWTVEAWANATSIEGPGIYDSVLYDTTADPNYYIGLTDSNEIEVGFGYANNSFRSCLSSTSPISTGSFYHIYGTFTNSTDTLLGYVNGTQVCTNTSATSDPDTSDDIELGSNTFSEHFDGVIDEIRISNIVRSTDWMTTTYNSINAPSTFYTISGIENEPNTSSGEGPILFWNMDEGTGTTIGDNSGNGNNGTRTNALWQLDDLCVEGKCLYFDGTGDFVSRATDADFHFTAAQSFSMTGWFRHAPSSSGQDIILARHVASGSTGGYKLLMEADGDITCAIDDDDTFDPDASATSTAATYDDNAWHYFACTKNGTSSLILYIDGIAVTTNSSISGIGSLVNDDTLYVGIDGDGSSNGWVGFLDEVKMYRRALSADQVKVDFVRGGGPRGAAIAIGQPQTQFLNQGLVGYWKMDESSWNGTAGEVLDTSGNTNNYVSACIGGGCTKPSTANAKFANGGSFDGTEDYVSGSLTPNIANSSFTISGWVYQNSAANAEFLAIGNQAANQAIEFQVFTSSAVRCGFYNNDLNLSSGFTAGIWQHLACTYDVLSGRRAIYLNGILRASDVSASSFSGTNTLTIGKNVYADGKYWAGKIDDIRIYNRSLSNFEISTLYSWAPGPVGWWKLDENTGTSANDSSGNANTGTITAGTGSYRNGKFGSSFLFDNLTSIINAGSGTSVDELPATGMSIATWIYPESQGEGSAGFLLAKNVGTTPSSGWIVQMAGTNALTFAVDGSTDLVRTTNNSVLTTNAWNHVEITWDGVITTASTVRVYINGTEVTYATTTNGASRVSDGTSTLYIGNDSTQARTFHGNIDDARIYNYVRTSEQVVEDMNAGHPAGGSPVGSYVARWKMDDLSGTTAQDFTGNNNDLTLSAASWTASGKFDGAWNGDGTNPHLSRADDADFDFATSEDFSLSAWVKSDSTSNPAGSQFITDKQVATNNPGYRLFFNTSGQIVCDIDDDTSSYPEDAATGTTDYYDNAWHHVVCIRDIGQDKLHLYVDGRLHAQDTDLSATGDLSNADALTVGAQDTTAGGTDDFAGDIDEVKIYRLALAASEVGIDKNLNSTVSFGDVDDHDEEGLAMTGPVGWWKLDENTGQTVIDSSGNNYPGTLGSTSSVEAGDPSWVRAIYGTGLSFDSTDDHLNIDTDAQATVHDVGSSDSLTISAWVRRTGNAQFDNAMSIVTHQNTDSNPGYKLMIAAQAIDCDDGGSSENRICFEIFDGTDRYTIYTGTDTLTADATWHHLAGVFDRSSTANNLIYIDGVAQSVTRQGTLGNIGDTAGGMDVCIGSHTAGTDCRSDGIYAMNGQIDDVRIYKYAFTQAQISYVYNRGAPVVWYKFDECTGSTAYNASLNAIGAAAGMNGTITIGAGGSESTIGDCSTSSTAWFNGSIGKYTSSIDLDGTDDYVSTTNANPIDQNVGLFNGATFSAWVNADSDGEGDVGRIFTKNTNTWCRTDSQSGSNLDIECSMDLATDAVLNISTAITIGTWNHVVVGWTNDGDDEITVWVNGQNRGTSASGTPGSGDPSTDTANLIVGNDTSAATTSFDGRIDHFQVFNYEMTDAQVKRLYNEGAAQRFGPQTGSP